MSVQKVWLTVRAMQSVRMSLAPSSACYPRRTGMSVLMVLMSAALMLTVQILVMAITAAARLGSQEMDTPAQVHYGYH